jgi:hypothetical protein
MVRPGPPHRPLDGERRQRHVDMAHAKRREDVDHGVGDRE